MPPDASDSGSSSSDDVSTADPPTTDGSSSDGDGSTGAPGSGTVDASLFASIQDAIDSLEGQGGAVYIAAGTHEITEKLRVHSDITVFGAGMDATIIRFADGVEPDHMIGNDSQSGRENIVIRDLTLQGPGPGPGINACCNGVKLERVHNAVLIAVASRNHGRDGFYLGYKHVDDAIEGVTGTRVSGCIAEGNGRNGLSIVQGQDILVDGGHFVGNNTHEAVAAIDLEPDPYPDGLVTGNRIVGNVVADNANNGIQLWADGGAIVANNAVCNNEITGNAGTGIADHQADDDVFVGNTFENNGADASYDGSAHVGDDFADACGRPLPELPAPPPLP